MRLYFIFQIVKANVLERTRRFSFLMICALSLFLAFFSVPNVDAPLVSICMEPNVFHQGSNPSWIPITIALCGGILFPLIGLSFIKNSITMDRNNGLLYSLQSMNMKKSNYIIGKFLSNLVLLTVMWLFVVIGAAIMLPSQYSNQLLSLHDFISPFIGVYPGIFFTAALAILLESVPFIKSKAGNTIGMTILFILFLINYSTSNSNYPLLRIFDFSNYNWVMDSINSSVIPLIGREVQETGILVPGGMFAGSKGAQELVFHGLLKSSPYLIDKLLLFLVSIILILLGVVSLESTEQKRNVSTSKLHGKDSSGKKVFYHNQFVSEYQLLLRDLPKSYFVCIIGMWIYCIFAPLKYVQNYLWIIMLIFSVSIFAQMGCKEYESNLREFFVTIKSSLIKQFIYSYLCGIITLLLISGPVIIRNFGTGNAISYIILSIFVPALGCFLGEYFKSRKVFETIYLLLCFLLLNMPTFLFQGYVVLLMGIGSIVCIFTTSIRRLTI